MEQIIIVLTTILLSTSMFIFWVAKGGFNRKFLYTDNVWLGLVSSVVNLLIYKYISMPLWLMTPFVSGFVVLVLFIALFLYRFFRNPVRIIPGERNDIVSPADGRVIYIKELETNQIPVTIKKKRVAHISEITKTDILEQPCYLIGIAMTLFDVHFNRAPIDGKVIMVKHTPGTSIGLNTPESTLTNERNTTVFEREDGVKAGVVQIAARGVNRCIVMSKEGEVLSRGQIFGKIRWGSQADLIIPRNCEIMVREGEQVHAGSTIVAKIL
ncbi:MAG: phosphatidylserine decarboxylase family protein [Bacteroidota bacterium]|nr:MAG: phosphatidylserine decarboxylase family protein [Bacteroidota bacterium]